MRLQLAKPYTRFPVVPFVFTEPKVDGYRLVAVIKDGRVAFYSRQGNAEPYTRNLAANVGRQLLATGLRDAVVDGELLVDGAWGTTALAKKVRLTPAEQARLAKGAVFYAFDLLSGGRGDQPLTTRRARLVAALRRGGKNLRVLPQTRARSDAEVQAQARKYLAAGFEGAMVKLPDAPYAFSRSSNWLKLKPVKTLDMRITGFQRGTGKYANVLGALVGTLRNGTKVKVGTGITDAQRRDWWKRQTKLKGKWIEIAVQGHTKVAAARHPRFVRFRADL
jgi:DNA ligase-1